MTKNEVPDNWSHVVKNFRELAADKHFDLAKTWLESDASMHLSQDRLIQQAVQMKRVSTTNNIQPNRNRQQAIHSSVEPRCAKERTATATNDPTTAK